MQLTKRAWQWPHKRKTVVVNMPSGIRLRTTPTTHVSSVGSHDSQVVVVDNLFHLLDTAEITQHVADRNNVSVLDELVGDLLGGLDSSRSNGLEISRYPCDIEVLRLTFSIK
jgi:hypothetical protein